MENPAFESTEDTLTFRNQKKKNKKGTEEDVRLESFRQGGTHLTRTKGQTEVAKTEASKGTLNEGPGEGGAAGSPDDAVNLQRRVGLFSGVALIVGTMIGSGIFVSPKGVLERTGSPALSLVVWAGCGILSLMGALCYAELGTLITSSGGEYAYYCEAMGNKKKRLRSWWRPLPAFLFAWVSVFLLKPSSLAIITLSSAEYMVRLFRLGCDPTNDHSWDQSRFYSVKIIAVVIMIVITFINSYSVKLATKVQNIFTAAKLIAIVIIVIGGIYKLSQGNVQYLAVGFQGSTDSFGNIATAFYSGLWAYDGWNNLNYATEELKNPYTNLPRAIIIGIPLVTVCYILVNVSYLAVMSTDELLASETVAVLFGSRIIGVAGELIMILSVAFSTFGSANGSCFTAGRLCFVAAREGHMVDVLSYVHARKLTPSPALIFNAVIALLMVIPSDIGSLIDFFSFTAWIFYGGAMVALLVMRYTKKDAYRPYKVPLIIPILVLLISIYLVVGPIVDSPQIEYLYAACFIFAGLIFYFPFVYYKVRVPGMDGVTTFFQLLLEVVPTDVMPDAA